MMDRRIVSVSLFVVGLVFPFAGPAHAGPSLDDCQRTAQREAAQYSSAVHKSIAGCLQRMSGEILRRDPLVPDISKAINGCVADFHSLQKGAGKSDMERIKERILRACEPASGAHGPADVLGVGTPSGNQTMQAALRLDAYCGAVVAGIGSVEDWIDCALAAAECQAQQLIAVSFPRAVEWLELLEEAMSQRTDPRGVEAHAALVATLTAIDGVPAGDGLADIACGPAPVDAVCEADLAAALGELATCAAALDAAVQDLSACEADADACSDALALCVQDLNACLDDPGAGDSCGDGVLDPGEECDQANLGGATCSSEGFAGGTLACAGGCVLDSSACWPTRFADNGDGSIADNATGLTWEKKVALGGGTNYGNLQDADNTYRWAGTCSAAALKRCQPSAAASAACFAGVQGDAEGCDVCGDGEGVCNVATPGITVWQWLDDLNASAFAGSTAWRLPTRAELETVQFLDFDTSATPLIDAAFHGSGCASICVDVTDPDCACTRSDGYWTASSYALTPSFAWAVNFMGGAVSPSSKTLAVAARAVRAAD